MSMAALGPDSVTQLGDIRCDPLYGDDFRLVFGQQLVRRDSHLALYRLSVKVSISLNQ